MGKRRGERERKGGRERVGEGEGWPVSGEGQQESRRTSTPTHNFARGVLASVFFIYLKKWSSPASSVAHRGGQVALFEHVLDYTFPHAWKRSRKVPALSGRPPGNRRQASCAKTWQPERCQGLGAHDDCGKSHARKTPPTSQHHKRARKHGGALRATLLQRSRTRFADEGMDSPAWHVDTCACRRRTVRPQRHAKPAR